MVQPFENRPVAEPQTEARHFKIPYLITIPNQSIHLATYISFVVGHYSPEKLKAYNL